MKRHISEWLADGLWNSSPLLQILPLLYTGKMSFKKSFNLSTHQFPQQWSGSNDSIDPHRIAFL